MSSTIQIKNLDIPEGFVRGCFNKLLPQDSAYQRCLTCDGGSRCTSYLEVRAHEVMTREGVGTALSFPSRREA